MAFIQKISFDALEGPDDTTWEWQEEIGEKCLIEQVMRELIDRVVESSGRMPVARVLFAEHEDVEVSDMELTDNESDITWIDTRNGDVKTCDVCSQSEWTIMERIVKGDGTPVDNLREYQGRVICGCCEEMLESSFSDYKWCNNCFLSEKMAKRYGISMIPLECFPEEHVCAVCNDIYPEIASRGNNDEEPGVPGEWDGVPGEWEQLLDGRWVLNGEIYEDEDYETYNGEYENENPRENNTELAVEIKHTISELGEDLFDIKEKLTEGEYLKMMDLLQKITNDVNRL